MGKKQRELEELGKLRESIEMMEELLDNAYYGMVLVDTEGYIVKWNYEKLLGIREEDVLGKHVKEVIPNTRLHIVAKTGEKELCDIQEIHGKKVITSRIPIIKEGKHLGAAGTVLFSDISELQALAKKVQILEDALNKYKGEVSKLYQSRYTFDDIVSNNFKMVELKTIAKRVAKTNSTILIQGESGTGKELFAHAIHRESSRKYGNFVTVNCAAIPKELLESELFGYEEGAFTGAKKGGKMGKFELATGGTIFLDEIGCLSMDMQSKLLRVLEGREFERVGGNKPIKLDTRIIAATNEKLEEEILKGNFRKDLYYRLNVIKLEIPPLRERLEDIEIIAKKILNKLAIDLNMEEKILTKDGVEVLKKYYWPGNVRELRNVLERAVNLAPKTIIRIQDFPEYIRSNHKTQKGDSNCQSLKEKLEEIEKDIIKKTIEEVGGNKTLAAEKLKIHRTSLYKKLEKYNMIEYL
ncbi:sigma-54 interaction domain-containing protein [Anaerobranca gottschalkii]|uniref:PAS domain S-box-containing protein n=1 Tax=Anaerobranca gottschalkii DSM 13577 TaxID=1120990 RepID=A0A1I0AUV6_9FIRM|nr:sigma 54-interacting transcriptional regulator [Anaerobranca gottschalkii]SES97574.1 PAS domain S-box-containing protein [Anaerobranca gottschalkii DSM 13577]